MFSPIQTYILKRGMAALISKHKTIESNF